MINDMVHLVPSATVIEFDCATFGFQQHNREAIDCRFFILDYEIYLIGMANLYMALHELERLLMKYPGRFPLLFTALLGLVLMPGSLLAHGVDDSTRNFLANNQGVAIVPFLYIGAKHMVTGYDHLLFLVGVIFFLYKLKDVLIYVSFFTIGHSLTLLLGVFNDVQVNAFLIDAIIGLSIVYKGFDNLGGFKRLTGFQPNTKAAVLIFGLFHGFGLATKLQEFEFGGDGLLPNLLAFNVGVELGQFIALGFVLLVFGFWRRYPSFLNFSTVTNTLLMSGGLLLALYQTTGYLLAETGAI